MEDRTLKVRDLRSVKCTNKECKKLDYYCVSLNSHLLQKKPQIPPKISLYIPISICQMQDEIKNQESQRRRLCKTGKRNGCYAIVKESRCLL